MSDFNPFSAAPEEVPAPSEVADEESGSRKTLLLVGALAAVAVGAGAFLFLGGGDEAEEDFTPVARAPRAAAPAASPAPPAAKLPVTTKVALGRNPFRALYVQPGAAAAAPAGAGTTTTTATSPGTGTTTTPMVVVDSSQGNPPPQSGGGNTTPPQSGLQQPAPQQPAPAPSADSTVALKGVAAGKDGKNPTGTFVYDGKEVAGAPGDVMAGKLLVLSLQQDATGGWFANLQLGDGSPFEVHERQTVVVQ